MANNPFDTLSEQLTVIQEQISQLQKSITVQPSIDRWLSIDELSAYLPGKPSKATIYSLVSRRAIPHSKQGKRLAFRLSAIDKWLREKERKPLDGADYLTTKAA